MSVYSQVTKINNWLDKNVVVGYLLIFLTAFLFFFWLQYAPLFADPDSFYHVGITEMMIETKGAVKDFPYLPFTTLEGGFIDHHFLYHVYLIPFIIFLPPLIGAKLGHIILVATLITVFYWLLRQFQVKGAAWITWLLFLSSAFAFRMSLIKAQPLSLIILLLGIYFILHRRYWWLFFLSAIYVLSYGGWFLLFIFGLIYVFTVGLEGSVYKCDGFIGRLAKIFSGHKNKWKVLVLDFFDSVLQVGNLKILGAIFFGSLVGIIVSPYFPTNLDFFWIQGVKIGLQNYQGQIGVGAEWYPYLPQDFIKNSIFPLLLMATAMIMYFAYHRRLPLSAKYLFWLTLMLFLATIKARRNIEYLIPFGVIFSAVVWSAVFKIKESRQDLINFKAQLKKYLFFNKLISLFLISVVSVALFSLAFNAVDKLKASLSGGWNFDYMSGASLYIKENAQPDTVIFHSDWDDFPSLFFHNRQNYYIIGLDPTFMYLNDNNLYYDWLNVAKGDETDNMYQVVKDKFKADYVIITSSKAETIKNFDNNFYFERVYQDRDAIIYKVL